MFKLSSCHANLLTNSIPTVKEKTTVNPSICNDRHVFFSHSTGYLSDFQTTTSLAQVPKPLPHENISPRSWDSKTFTYPAEVTSSPFLAKRENSEVGKTVYEFDSSRTEIGSSRETTPGQMQNTRSKQNCQNCSKNFFTLQALTKHQALQHCTTLSHSNTNRKAFHCKYCDKLYVSLGALKMHIRTHTLPCKCKICGKAFSRPWLLQGHIRTHTGEKPYKCNTCQRAFADRSNLRAHLQTHSDVKKYCCTRCSKSFSRMSLLLKHEDSGCPASF